MHIIVSLSFFFNLCLFPSRGFPGSSVVKNMSASAGDIEDVGLVPGV